jgi:hypothetical protein
MNLGLLFIAVAGSGRSTSRRRRSSPFVCLAHPSGVLSFSFFHFLYIYTSDLYSLVLTGLVTEFLSNIPLSRAVGKRDVCWGSEGRWDGPSDHNF